MYAIADRSGPIIRWREEQSSRASV